MLDIALHYGEGAIFLKDIAKRQGISEKYLGQLIPPLKTANLINSNRGAHGGYLLAREPSDITLKEVVKAVEGNHVLAECIIRPDICPRSDLCITRDVWEDMSAKMMGVLEEITLKDLISRHQEKIQSQPIMYYI